jgi:hypothetical protein
MKGHDGIVQVFFQPAAGFDQDILDHVTDVDTLLNLAIKPHFHQPTDRRAVTFKQLIDRFTVALTSCV